jgi:adenylate cyclase
MPDREYAVTARRRIAAPPPVVWAIVTDTNRLNRALRLAPATYSYEELVPGDPASRVRACDATEMGLKLHWVEPPYEWLEARMLNTRRVYRTGPFTTGFVTVALAPVDGNTATDLEITVGSTGRSPLAWIAATAVLRRQFRAGLARYLDAVEATLAGHADLLATDWTEEPPGTAVRRALVSGDECDPTLGKLTAPDETSLAYRAKRFAGAPVEPALRERIAVLLRTTTDDELQQIRPFELARAWGLDRREVLRGFLHAARAGLVDLHWQLNCPTCRVASESAGSLADVRSTAHCETCNIAFDLDFAAHVEAVFRPNPAVRKIDTALYCASGPWFRPHVFAQLRLAHDQTRREITAVLPPGQLTVRLLRGRARANVDVGAAPPASLDVRVTADAITVTPSGRVPGGGETTVTLANETGGEVLLVIERTGWNADVVLGSAIATLPDFLDLFAAEAPAAGVELTVGTLTVLFSDLTGSTALYERVGDARAFALVQEHFRDMTRAIAQHEGAIVKTMGDAVMATFESPVRALRAALEMVREAERAHAREGLSVKLGLHDGPCLAVRANERLDFFGTTVNVAARLQAQAGGGEVVVAAELLEHPEIAALVRERGLPLRRFEAHLKGIREVQKLVALDARAGVAAPADLPRSRASQGS